MSAAHIDRDTLTDYWLGDTDAEATESIDAHLMGCDACGAQLDELIALARGVRAAFDHGEVRAAVTGAFVERLEAAGRQVHEYRVPHNGSVVCSLAPGDDQLISRLDAPLAGVTRIDAEFAYSFAPGRPERLRDIPFDAAGGEVLFAPKMSFVRQLSSHDFVVRLLAVDDSGERELGRYTFHHQAAG
ncbi:MAG TPA: zf-HC2 domain-containing protein [Burkholderiaceae bacterium]|nr:zf-HC2 domain-containing protein [Burkholderiaceae bacterium]